MKRYNCTLRDKRGEFGDCMEKAELGKWVRFSDVERLIAREKALLAAMDGIASALDELSHEESVSSLKGGAAGAASGIRKSIVKIIMEAAPAAGEGVAT